ncbi:carbohydrate ABC transporter permease [Paenibacillus eucommiae]|uniref:ABC-type glycerol-3-phosphate transport system permease component n=1 Tax=Paenibacillus eucommiae TaxID=1355755 RepID=A0ABS4IW13_9BACL|nr:carbohydrate ABC transporter permease [Paenibacillus eucommiae]MBP1990704.1 ABC-type glycerol-3-phosphate transport system permease component [Paenibacillus eucommiae]
MSKMEPGPAHNPQVDGARPADRRFRIRFRLRIGKLDPFQTFTMIGLSLLALFMLLPIVFIINHAFKPISELFLYPPRFWSSQPTWFNFQQLILKSQTTVIPFSRYLFNSVLTTGVTVAGVIFISSMAAYAFSKQRFMGSGLLFSFTIVALMFAPETVAIPRFLVIANLGIMDTYLVHVLPLLAAPVGVFLMKQFIDQIPNELIEAAKIDGAQEFMVFFRIVLPVCMPAVATIGILAFQGSWAQTETSSLFTHTESMKTLPYYTMTLTNGLANNVVGQGIAAAAGLIMFLPNLVVFLLFQRRVLNTMAHSGIK